MKRRNLMALVLAGVMAASVMGCASQSGAKNPSETQKEAAKEGASNESVSKDNESGATDSAAVPAGSWKPDHDITIRVPNAAGGTMDTITRILGQGIQQSTGTTVMINNLTGASGAIAANDLLAKDADPCELMTSGIALFTLAPLFNQDIKVSLDDFAIVSGMVSEDFVLCVNPEKSGIHNWEELKAYGEKERILFGSNTPGGTTHMLGTALFGEAGLNAEAVTSDGTNKDMLALTSGDVVCAIGNASACQQFIEEGTAVPIVVFSADAYKGFEGFTVPSVVDLGYDIQFKSCNFLMAKKGADQAALDQIHDMIQAYTETEECKKLAESAKYVPDIADGETVRAMIEDSAKMCQEIYEKYYH